MATFNNGESAASVRTKINAAIEKVDGTSPITSVDIDSGTIDGTAIGGSNPAAISGTTGTFSGNLTVDANTLFVDAWSNRVGIGTSSPERPLHIRRGSGAGTVVSASTYLAVLDSDSECVLQFRTPNTESAWIRFSDPDLFSAGAIKYDHAIDAMMFYADASESMRIDSNGNIGIGTSSPSFPLDVNGTIRTTDDIQLTNGSISQLRFSDSTGTNGYIIRANVSDVADFGLIFEDLNNTDLYIIGQSDPHIWYSQAGVERMRINSSGDLGIGTSSPSEILHIQEDAPNIWIDSTSNGETSFNGRSDNGGLLLTAGGMNTTSKYTPAIMFGSTDPELTTNTPRIGAAIVAEAAQTFSADTAGAMHLTFWTRDFTGTTAQNALERMRIDNNGNVGIGTSSPARTLHVNDVMRLEPRATAPPSAAKGDIYFDSSDDKLKCYDGTVWQDLF